jgi:hypothetical protein
LIRGETACAQSGELFKGAFTQAAACAVRYTGTVSPVLVGVCHCRDCQKFTGGAFGFLVGVPRDAFELRGTVKSYSKPADSGRPIVRRFCPKCGSSIAEE